MPDLTHPDDARDYYAHVRTCTDNLCRSWPHMWATTTEGAQYIDEQNRGEKAQRERRAYR